MMKFFRKYNKQLLAVFASALLVFWLGGTALQSAFSIDPTKEIIGRADTGTITVGDRNLAEYNADLQRWLNMSWEQQFANPYAARDEQMNIIDWILLQREAKKYGISVHPEQARRVLAASGMGDSVIQTVAIKRDITPERLYAAAAEFLTVRKYRDIFLAAMDLPEAEIRVNARDMQERASVDVAIFPAIAFVEEDDTFTDEEIKAQFEEYKDRTAEDGLNFGYYIKPQVKIQYIEVNPEEIVKGLRGKPADYTKRAIRYWKDNPEDPAFRKPADVVRAEQQTARDAATNGLPPAEVSNFYTEFDQIKQAAIDLIMAKEAKAEADRIAGELTPMLSEPWFGIQIAKANQYKPAPEEVKSLDYFDEVISKLSPNLQYEGGVQVGLIDWITETQLTESTGLGSARVELGINQSMPFSRLAFMVQGLEEIPETNTDSRLYLSQWQTSAITLRDGDKTYFFRVVGVREGRVPDSVDEVKDSVIEDLRLVRGMERAKQRAADFAARADKEEDIKTAWEANTELQDLIVPNEGGFHEAVTFSRRGMLPNSEKPTIRIVGQVNKAFMDTAFKLAEAGKDASEVATIDLPDTARVVVLKGNKLNPLYKEFYNYARSSVVRSVQQQKALGLLSDWCNGKQIRERNNFKMGDK